MKKIQIKPVVSTLLYLPLITVIILIGLYPLQFILLKGKPGILSMKSDGLLSNVMWNVGFYIHILLGGLALLIGWVQFNKGFRQRNASIHRTIGKIYVASVLLSSLAGLYIGFFAEGGPVAFAGFTCGNLIWFYSTISAYSTILEGALWEHQKMMIFSYATCLSAVTLRIWLPLLANATENFILSYQLISWISWAPNLVVAYFIVKWMEHRTAPDNFTNNTLYR